MAATLSDCIYGQAVGGALGVPYEFMGRGSFTCSGMTGHGTHNQPAGTWSDGIDAAGADAGAAGGARACCLCLCGF